MTADVELLPSSVAAFVEALKGERGSLDAWLEVNNEREVAAHVEAYAHATAAKDAEIEALRAEVVHLTRTMGATTHLLESAAEEMDRREARAKRLADALREIEQHALHRGNGDLLQFVRAALHPTAAQENE